MSKLFPLPSGGHFRLDDSGVWFIGIDKDGKALQPYFVCAPLRVVDCRRDGNLKFFFALEFRSYEGVPVKYNLSAFDLACGGFRLRSDLMIEGLEIAPTGKALRLLPRYIQVAGSAVAGDHA